MTQPERNQGEQLPAAMDSRREVLVLGNRTEIDLSMLSESDRKALKMACLQGQIELQQKLGELSIENHALAERLASMAETVTKAETLGASVTVTGAYNDQMGRTEIIMGNTDTAARGKLDRSQKGEQDFTIVYVVIGAIFILILAGILAAR